MKDVSELYLKTAEESAMILAQSRTWKEKIKHYLALYQQAFVQEGMAVSKSEMLARAHPDYKNKIDEATILIGKAEVARARLKSIEMKFEFERSSEATRRAELKML